MYFLFTFNIGKAGKLKKKPTLKYWLEIKYLCFGLIFLLPPRNINYFLENSNLNITLLAQYQCFLIGTVLKYSKLCLCYET